MEIILLYVPCSNTKEAKTIAVRLLQEKLCGCVNIIPMVKTLFLWPPHAGKIEETKEAILLIKTVKTKYTKLEKMISKLHSYDTPCILKIVANATAPFYQWLSKELK